MAAEEAATDESILSSSFSVVRILHFSVRCLRLSTWSTFKLGRFRNAN